MQEICPKVDCTGCQTCKQICPQSAIRMLEDEMGHIYPSISQQDCIDCGLCVEHCPSINVPEMNSPIKVMAGWITDVAQRKASTSGGISYILSKWIVIRGGYFCGVVWDKKTKGTKHELTNDISCISQFQGSKYSHSDTSNIFKEIKVLILKGKEVLFIGTPCQIAGLKAFLAKDYKNLYTVDLICHGVPSRKLLRDRIDTVEKNTGKSVVNMKSREKTPNQYSTSVKYFYEDGSSTLVPIHKDFFFRCFVENYCLRPNCYKCKYSNEQRVSDLTIGDFWGYVPYSLKFRSYRKGTSVMLINTDKGIKLFESIKPNLICEERKFSEALSCNRNLGKPQIRPLNYDEFWKRYLSGENIQILFKTYFPPLNYKSSPRSKLRAWVKMLLPLCIVKLLERDKR